MHHLAHVLGLRTFPVLRSGGAVIGPQNDQKSAAHAVGF